MVSWAKSVGSLRLLQIVMPPTRRFVPYGAVPQVSSGFRELLLSATIGFDFVTKSWYDNVQSNACVSSRLLEPTLCPVSTVVRGVIEPLMEIGFDNVSTRVGLIHNFPIAKVRGSQKVVSTILGSLRGVVYIDARTNPELTQSVHFCQFSLLMHRSGIAL